MHSLTLCLLKGFIVLSQAVSPLILTKILLSKQANMIIFCSLEVYSITHATITSLVTKYFSTWVIIFISHLLLSLLSMTNLQVGDASTLASRSLISNDLYLHSLAIHCNDHMLSKHILTISLIICFS